MVENEINGFVFFYLKMQQYKIISRVVFLFRLSVSLKNTAGVYWYM